MAFVFFIIAIALPIAKLLGLAVLATVSWWLVFTPLIAIAVIWLLYFLFVIGGMVFMTALFSRR